MPDYRSVSQKLLDFFLAVKSEPLNLALPSAQQSTPEALDIQLKRKMALIRGLAIDTSTGKINYAYLKNLDVYRDYRQLTRDLASFDLHSLDTQERQLAFWLNLYNALVIDAVIHYGIRHSVNELSGFFRRAAYCIGGYSFSLDDIEHGILRANAGHPFIPGPQFGNNDPRKSFSLAQIDYRIHFALVCGAISCPPVNFYDAEKMDTQLDLATRNYLSQTVEIIPHSQQIHLPKLLQWYGEDFGTSRWVKLGFGDASPILLTLNAYLMSEAWKSLIELGSSRIKVVFQAYDWTVNAL